jgi:hypothetical protein
MNRDTNNPIEAKTHWNNPKHKTIPIGLECLEQTPHKKEKLTYVSTYLYGKLILKTKEVHQLHETLDGGCFEIYVGQN